MLQVKVRGNVLPPTYIFMACCLSTATSSLFTTHCAYISIIRTGLSVDDSRERL